jgi:hypothetical protein
VSQNNFQIQQQVAGSAQGLAQQQQQQQQFQQQQAQQQQLAAQQAWIQAQQNLPVGVNPVVGANGLVNGVVKPEVKGLFPQIQNAPNANAQANNNRAPAAAPVVIRDNGQPAQFVQASRGNGHAGSGQPSGAGFVTGGSSAHTNVHTVPAGGGSYQGTASFNNVGQSPGVSR